jgi:hypothetical protein
MTQITIDVSPETIQHIHAMLDKHRDLTFDKLAGKMLDAQVAYRLEVERTKPGPGVPDAKIGGW